MGFSIITNLYNHHQHLIPEHFQQHITNSPKHISSHSPLISVPCRPWQPPVSFLTLWIYLFWIFQTDTVIQYVVFCIWLLSIDVFPKFIHVIMGVRPSFLFMMNTIPLNGYTTFCLSSHLLVDICCFHLWLLWIMLLLTFLYKYWCEYPIFNSFWEYTQGVELLGHMVFCLTCWGAIKLFSTVTALFYQPHFMCDMFYQPHFLFKYSQCWKILKLSSLL